ncbi:hypothetical protein TPY_2299 [Sulfobacillus acidophilus TPY]|nr:hypothetical protein TPY_2299 [Sulfobacillus acidophilus TPY]
MTQPRAKWSEGILRKFFHPWEWHYRGHFPAGDFRWGISGDFMEQIFGR